MFVTCTAIEVTCYIWETEWEREGGKGGGKGEGGSYKQPEVSGQTSPGKLWSNKVTTNLSFTSLLGYIT